MNLTAKLACSFKHLSAIQLKSLSPFSFAIVGALLLEVNIWSWSGALTLSYNESTLSWSGVKGENVASTYEEKTSTIITTEQRYV